MNGKKPTPLEQAKLDFEREKLALEEKSRRQTFLWTVCSGVLTAAVTLSVAWLGVFGKREQTKAPSSISVERAVACRDSLQRLISLGLISGQTVPTLADAAARHKGACDAVLTDLIGELEKK
jgi:hypothetical protein